MMKTTTKTHICPNCSEPLNKVNVITMSHHLAYPVCTTIPNDEVFSYCKNPSCELAYFSDTTCYTKDQMQSKQQVFNKTVCFCFGITEDVFLEQVNAGKDKAFFANLDELADTRKCVCKQKNPSGKGCLAVFKQLHSMVSASAH